MVGIERAKVRELFFTTYGKHCHKVDRFFVITLFSTNYFNPYPNYFILSAAYMLVVLCSPWGTIDLIKYLKTKIL